MDEGVARATWLANRPIQVKLALAFGGMLLAFVAACIGIVAALDMPLVHFSVYWWRTLHQPPSLLKPGGFTGSAAILTPLLVNVAAFTLLYAYLVAKRARLLRAERGALA